MIKTVTIDGDKYDVDTKYLVNHVEKFYIGDGAERMTLIEADTTGNPFYYLRLEGPPAAGVFLPEDERGDTGTALACVNLKALRELHAAVGRAITYLEREK